MGDAKLHLGRLISFIPIRETFSVRNREGCPPYAPGLAGVSKKGVFVIVCRGNLRVPSTMTNPGS